MMFRVPLCPVLKLEKYPSPTKANWFHTGVPMRKVPNRMIMKTQLQLKKKRYMIVKIQTIIVYIDYIRYTFKRKR